MRTLCLECGTTDTLDLCDSPACERAVVYIKDKNGNKDMSAPPHLPSHDVARLREHVPGYDLGRVLRRSKAALAHARETLGDAERTVRAAAAPGARAASSLGLPVRRAQTPSPAPLARAHGARVAPTCIRCQKPVGYPCYACFECTGE